jgi:cell division protein FtsZ
LIEVPLESATENFSGSTVIIIAGLGGKSAGHGAAALVEQLKRKAERTACFVTWPFDFEGGERRDRAQEALDKLQETGVLTARFRNQDLFRLADDKTTFAEAFRLMEKAIYDAIAEYLQSGTVAGKSLGLIEWDFSSKTAKAA